MSYTSNANLEDLFDPRPLERTEKRIVKRVGEELHTRVRRHTPVAKPPPGAWAEWLGARKRSPGTLKNSWRIGDVDVVIDGELYRVAVYTLDPVAPHVEWNTQPHLIVPKDPNGLLRYWDRSGGKVFAKVVHHPGTRGVHMMATALTEVVVAWRRIAAEEVRIWTREQVAGVR
jgi:hypothetical protein